MKIGDRVRTSRHGYTGTITSMRRLNSSDRDWVQAQTLSFTREQLGGVFVSLSVDGGGAVLTPVSTCKRVR